jgi:hypothetical protein
MAKFALLVAAMILPSLGVAQGITNCTLRLNVKLSPGVENPTAPAFLSTLAGNPAYSLILVSVSEDVEVMQLTGPADTCRSQVKVMRTNSHVIEMHIVGNDGLEEDDEI